MKRTLNCTQGEIHRLGNPLVFAHLLTDAEGCVLIDCGLTGIPSQLRALFQKLGRTPDSLKAILLTHGHLDHTGGLAAIRDWSGAKVYAHPDEAARMAGTAPYYGINRVGGAMEWLGRLVLRYRPAAIDHPIKDGDVLPFWGGLRVLHLPGHTPGHCALMSERTGLIFCGDMFASYSWSAHFPPAIFNVDGKRLRQTIKTLGKVAHTGIIPSHYDRLDPALHAERLRRLLKEQPE